MRLSIHVPKV